MEERVAALVKAGWESRLGIDHGVLDSDGVHVVVANVGDNDAMSFLLDQTCIIAVRERHASPARDLFAELDVRSAFTADSLRRLLGDDARVDGPSAHCYVDERSFSGQPDPSASPVVGDAPALTDFLRSNSLEDWAESGFPRNPSSANPRTTRYWVLRDDDGVVAAGNLTEWRGLPADVGALTAPSSRGLGFAGRLVGTMVHAALPAAGVVRYRALAANTASLAVARRVGFEPYSQNFRARITSP